MHYDPLISSRTKSLVSWGHDWVVLTLIVAFPVWAPSKVFALPIAMRLYRNRQGLTKGKKKPKGKKSQKRSSKPKRDPNHRTRPELALELIVLVAQWFPNDEIVVLATVPTGGKASSLTCRRRFTSSAMSIPRGRSTNRHLPRRRKAKDGPARKETACLA